MESSLSSIRSLVNEVKEKKFAITTRCAYGADAFPANLACMAAPKTWILEEENIDKVTTPSMYSMDEELMKLGLVDHLQRLGLAEHFHLEIDQILKEVHCNQRNQDQLQPSLVHDLPAKLYKDSLAFRLLRMWGYDVNPSTFCWFLNHEEILDYIERNSEDLISLLYTMYRATDLMFSGEHELEQARSYLKKLIEISISHGSKRDDVANNSGIYKLAMHEVKLPWITRLDHLDHRMWIEQNITTPPWIGNAVFYRPPCVGDEKLMSLASKNFGFRQSIYSKELKELTRWSENAGFTAVGFGREKTAYCYFATAASSCLPHDSMVRLIIAKTAILITVADDFYDMEGSMAELETLTDAIRRWDGMNLKGHGKTIFEALDGFVTDIVAKWPDQQRNQLVIQLRAIWIETFDSWMVEKSWSNSGYLPSMEEYLKTGMISIGIHTMLLMAYPCMNPSLQIEKIKGSQYHKTTELLMVTARLLNDTQSYQKELKDGKMNYVLLHQKQNPEGQIEDSVAYVKSILEENTKELLEHVLMDNSIKNDMPKSMKQLHLSCMKVFHMFFNSTNVFDSEAELLDDINKAFYVPLQFSPIPQKPPAIFDPTSKAKRNLLTITTRKKQIMRSSGRFGEIKIKCQGGFGIKVKESVKNPVFVAPMWVAKFA